MLGSNPEDTLVVSLQEHKIGIVVRNVEGESSLLLQVELNSARAKKKPLNISDVNLLKVLMMVLWERMQKFLIFT